MSDVIALPVLQLCLDCKHVAIVRSGLDCTLFNEPIADEREAEQCMGYERT